MLTPFGKPCGPVRDDLCVSTDEDMLENTKPNLISFSLSTSSSNHTNVSAATNSDHRDTENKCDALRRKNDIKKASSSVENEKAALSSHLINVPTNTLKSSVTHSNSLDSSDTRNIGTKVYKDVYQNKCSDGVKKNYFDLLNLNVVPQKSILSRKHSMSMYNLYEVLNSPKNDLVRVASQPQLNSHVTVKPFSRSVSSVTLKGRNQNYTHIQSKVKHYIQQLKKEKATEESSFSENVIGENISIPQCEQESVAELKKEIERLQTFLEERDTLLQEVRANHHSLLLQYGEAKNRLDHLRLLSVKPQQGIKSVQTEPYLKVDKNVSACLPSPDKFPVVFKETVSEASPSNIQRNVMDNIKQEDTGGNVNTDEISCSSDFADEHLNVLKGKKNVEKVVRERSSAHAQDLTLLKVSTWFTSLSQQPLPVPSCYGSLASSGSVCNQQEDNEMLELKNDDVLATNSRGKSRMPMMNSQSEQWDPKVHKEWSEETNQLDPKECYFLSIDKCECWNTNNVPDSVTLEVDSSRNSTPSGVRHSLPHSVSVPPLNLACSKDSISMQHTIPFQECNVPKNSTLCKVPTISQACHSVATHNIMPLNVNAPCCKQTASFHEKSRFYLDTPTSYKSILINCESGTKVNSEATSVCSLSSVSCDVHRCRKGEFQCVSIEHTPKNGTANNWERPHHQCRYKKSITSERNLIDHSHNCCLCLKGPHEVSRPMSCISRDVSQHLDSKIRPDIMKCLNSVSVCAEDLKRRSQAIQISLTKLLETTSESH